MTTNYNFNSTSNFNYTTQNSNPQIQAINMDTKDYDEKLILKIQIYTFIVI